MKKKFLNKGKKSNLYLSQLNYDYKDYLNFINDKPTKSEWKGVSVQQKEINKYNLNLNIPLDEAFSFKKRPPNLRLLTNKFVKLLNELLGDTQKEWIVKFDKNKYNWLSQKWKRDNRNNNLFEFFDKEMINYSQKGALCLSSDLMRKLLPELIGYPYLLNRRDLNLLNEDYNYIIRITNHFSIDIISKDEKIILNLLNEIDVSPFKIIHYS